MAPPKVTCMLPAVDNTRKGILTRSQNQNIINDNGACRRKRAAESSLTKELVKQPKRSAFGDITNDVNNVQLNDKALGKKPSQTKIITTLKHTSVKQNGIKSEKNPLQPRLEKILTRASIKDALTVKSKDPSVVTTTAVKPKDNIKPDTAKLNIRRITNEFEKTEDSLYISAVEDISNESNASKFMPLIEDVKNVNPVRQPTRLSILRAGIVPPGIHDFDKENWNDIFQVSEYAMDIFQYFKDRESSFKLHDYMAKQTHISCWMRSLLVDWMVEIQESFELNHETLYLAVKLVDLYLCKVTVTKEKLQLLGASALFIAAKFDERTPPLVDDFLYICDGAYLQREFLRTEMNILKVVDFNLGIPLSYRFLRRFARCSKVNMPTLTLARYILEFSLMDYETIKIPDSKLAAAVLFMAIKMKNVSNWTDVLAFYTGYTQKEIFSTVCHLNAELHKKPKESLSTVRAKYSHKIFFEVAKTPLLTNEQLSTPILDK